MFGLTVATKADPEKLLNDGHAAFVRGDYAGAAALYEQAEIHSIDPARVAYYLAGAKYHLALKMEGSSPELREAEQWYRCCLDPANPQRPRALLGLGNCLLRKPGTRDAAGLRSAIACYDQCLQSAGDDETLAADARYNREKARLMLMQFQPPPNSPPSDNSPRDGGNPQLPRPDSSHPMPVTTGEQGGEGNADGRSIDGVTKPEQGMAATKTNDPPSPGKGNLEHIPDEVDVPPLSPRDAAEHLELATQKVMRERQTHHRRGERPSATGVKDW